jgi:hypothetical protein
LQVGRRGCDRELLRRADEREPRALPLLADSEQPLALGVQLAVEALDKRERLRRERV